MSAAQPSTQASASTAALQPSGSSIKRLSTISKSSGADNKSKPGNGMPLPTAVTGGAPKDVVSPGELCGFVDTLLSSLETRFDEMSEQILGRMNEMSNRIDNLENTIQDLMQGGIEGPSPSPSPAPKR